MADGSHAFNFPPPQTSKLRPGEIVVDLFAGGGGASEALKQALGIDPALAYNHDKWAIGMHAANHPLTQHHRDDIWHADPVLDVGDRLVGWFHASPDCTHFSQAKGGQPRNRKIRALSWVVLKWAGQLGKAGRAPRIISMENVWQILTWGPLIAKRCKTTGRVLKMDGTVAAKGERVPVEQQQLVPDKRHTGRTWAQFVAALRGFGYEVEWRKLVASDYGAGTSRERLFLIARRDGEPIVWPQPTHGKAEGQQKPVTAADSIDFSDLGSSIFTRKRPLADATMRRIAKGVVKHVLQAAEPFIVSMPSIRGRSGDCDSGEIRDSDGAGSDGGRSPRAHDARGHNPGNASLQHPTATAPFIAEHANASNQRSMRGDEPLRTVCAGVKGGHFSVVTPILAGVGGRAGQTEPRPGDEPHYTFTAKADCALVSPVLVQTGYGEREGQSPRSLDIEKPLGTVVAGGVKHAVAGAFLEQANGGNWAENEGHDIRKPASTIMAKGSQQRLVTAHMATLRNNMHGATAGEPLSTVAAGGEHHAVVTCELSPEQEEGALRVAGFLISYYGNGDALGLRDPLDTVTTRDRLALVTVMIQGTPYVIVDIKLRMLKPAELFRAQGFPADYIIDRTADGTPISNTHAVRMVGNSVSPPPLRALAEANLDPVPVPERLAA